MQLRVDSPTTPVVYVGCLTHQAHHDSMSHLRLSITLATDLHLHDGEVVQGMPLLHIPRATKVMVSPLTVDESEVVEQNALRIEQELLRQVQVVYTGMPITVTAFAGVQARVRVTHIECGESSTTQFDGPAMMFDGTHFIIATRLRQALATIDGTTSSDKTV
uniref:Peroxisome biogenesis protein 1 n=1 Tax=Lygus hesperus TaxID=30085 RepID=A0A0A9WIY6_LYGHE